MINRVHPPTVLEGVDDFAERFAFVPDLRTDEAATIERIRRRGDDPPVAGEE